MILLDSSVWIDHFNHEESLVVALLDRRQLLVHPFAAGEVLLGNLRDPAAISLFLNNIEQASVVPHELVLDRLQAWKVPGRCVGWVDLHLLVSAELSDARLWTRDRRLGALADELGLRFAGS